jgi:hypothetical protein
MKRMKEEETGFPPDADGVNLKVTKSEPREHEETSVTVTNAESEVAIQDRHTTDSTIIEVNTPGVVISIHPNQPEPEIVIRNPDRSVLHIVRITKGRASDRHPDFGTPAPHVRIRKTAFAKVRATVGSLPAERGGIFVGPDPFCIEDFIFDEGKKANQSAVYFPDTAYLNEILERDHEPHGRRFVGLAHSHPNGYWRPSGDAMWGDVKAARNNLMSKSNADLPALFIPIVESAATTGAFALHPFIMLRRDLRVRPARYEIID